MVGCMEEYKETGKPSGRWEVEKQSIEDPNTHAVRCIHAPLSKWYG